MNKDCYNYRMVSISSFFYFPMQLLAVWMLADWKGAGEPGNCKLVELGPGRGTLIKDMLSQSESKILSGSHIH